MNVAELAIYYILRDKPGMIHVTPDETKVYFISDGKLMCMNAPDNIRAMSDEEIHIWIKKNAQL